VCTCCEAYESLDDTKIEISGSDGRRIRMWVVVLVYCTALREAGGTSETSVNFYQTTRSFILIAILILT
jgi:hypothetical protein